MTVLLADWARRGGRLVAWLSLDVGDNDPARFWRHVVAALGQVRPGAGISGAGAGAARARPPSQALTLPDRVLAQAATGGRIGSVIEIRALQALAHQASHDEPAAMAALVEALTLACPQGQVRVFADEGPPMGALLGRLAAAHRAKQALARRVPLGCLARLVQACDGKLNVLGSGRSAAPAVPGLIEPLTGRELQVLAMLAAGTPIHAIAGELFISIDTVKHVSQVLGKLGAANRTEAVARARDLGLIP